MKICEIFGNTIQGEGPWIGLPCIFIRTSGCNLKCRRENVGFDCDTQYHIEGEVMIIKEIMEKIGIYACKNIVITGGSPEIQRDIDNLIAELLDNDYKVQIETNGFAKFPSFYKDCLVVCSPKFNINEKEWLFNAMNKPDYYKFVHVENEKQILNFILNNHITNDKVFIMPEGETREKIIEHSKKTVEFCTRYGLRYSPREHIIIWDKKRGI